MADIPIVPFRKSAASSVFGRVVRVHAERGRWQASPLSPHTLITFHPSALLRWGDKPEGREMYHAMLEDLKSLRDLSREKNRKDNSVLHLLSRNLQHLAVTDGENTILFFHLQGISSGEAPEGG